MGTTRLTALVVFTAATALAVSGAAFAGPQPVGQEITLNAPDTDHVYRAAMAVAADGTLWSVWQSDVDGVVARPFAADLVPAAAATRVAGNQLPDRVPYRGPALVRETPVAVPLADGRLFVAWREQSLDVTADIFYQRSEVLSTTIAGRLLGPTGHNASRRFVIAEREGDAFGRPVALETADRRVVVAWTTLDAAGEATGIDAQIVRPNGRALTETFRLDDGAAASRPALAPAADGGFLALWQEGRDDGIFARTFDAEGFPLAASVALAPGGGSLPAVARGADGGYLAVWAGESSHPAIEELETQIYGRTLDAAGVPNGPRMALSSGGGIYHGSPGVAAGADGYLVAWSVWTRSAPWSVFGVSVDALGRPAGESFRLSERRINYQWSLALAADAGGRYVVAWDGYDADGEPSINARVVDTPSMAVNLCASGSSRCGR